MGNKLNPQTNKESSIEYVTPPDAETFQVFTDASDYKQDYETVQPNKETLKKLLDQTVRSENPSPLKVQLILEALEDIEGERTLKSMRDCIEEHSRTTGINFENIEDSLSRLEGFIYRKN